MVTDIIKQYHSEDLVNDIISNSGQSTQEILEPDQVMI
jgi:hypothetical protein